MFISRALVFAAALGLSTAAVAPDAWADSPPKRATAAQRASFKEALAAGRKAVKAKDYKTAITQFESALKVVPSSSSVLGELGWAYFLDGQLDKAEEKTNDAIRISVRAKQLGALHYNLGRVHEAAGKKDEARSEYTESLSYRNNDTVQKRVAGLGGVLVTALVVDAETSLEKAVGHNVYCTEPLDKSSADEDARCTWTENEDETLDGGGLDQVWLVRLEGSADEIGGSVDATMLLLRQGARWFNMDVVADSWVPGMDYIYNDGEVESFKAADLLPDLPGKEVLVVEKASSVDHDPGAEMTTSDMMKTWHLCGLLEGAPTCVSINVEVEWESNQLEGESWDAGKKLDGGKWALKMAIEDGQIAISTTGKVADLPPASQACLGRHTFAELTKKACANTRIGK
jgi:tetratricopeptide (TPR) repeat protein